MHKITAIALLTLAGGCATPAAQPQHPLLNTIVHSTPGVAVSRVSLADKMSAAAVVYLGEKHDNHAHHHHQLWLLNELIRRGYRPAVGFEIFPSSQTSELMEFAGTGKASDPRPGEARLRAMTGMQAADDERWLSYGPILQLARANQLNVFGIDLPVALRHRISRFGIDGLTAVERNALPGGDFLGTNSAYRDSMLARLKTAHCGYGENAYLQRLFQNWQARNETMARAITAAASAREGSPVIVILGGGHVRGGEGVVPRVAKRMPGARQLIVSFTEVDRARPDAADYVSGTHAESPHPPHIEELLWFTPAQGVSTEDACKAFRNSKNM